MNAGARGGDGGKSGGGVRGGKSGGGGDGGPRGSGGGSSGGDGGDGGDGGGGGGGLGGRSGEGGGGEGDGGGEGGGGEGGGGGECKRDATSRELGLGGGEGGAGGASREAADAAALRSAVLSAGAVGHLAPLLTSPATATDGALRVAALNALAQLVHGHAAAAAEVAAGSVSRSLGGAAVSEPLLPRLLSVALRSSPMYQAAAGELFGLLLRRAPQLQLALAAPLAAPAAPSSREALSLEQSSGPRHSQV